MTEPAQQPGQVETGVPADLMFVDCDSHWTEPADLWSSRVPASAQDRVPQLRKVEGRDCWILNDEVWASTGANVIGRGRRKKLGSHVMDDYADIDPAAWSVPHRLALMDDVGIHTSVIYPNGVGFASNHMFAIEEVEQRKFVFQTYNDFFADLQQESGRRLLPQAMLPIWDMDFTVQEMHRMLDRGITGFTLSDKPELLGLPELWEPYYDPMWGVFNEARAVANFHIGSGSTKAQVNASRRMTTEPRPPAPSGAAPAQPLAGYTAVSPAWREFGKQRMVAVLAAQGYMSNVRIIINLCMSNLFDRFPNLKIVSAESGIGWVPFILEALEYQIDDMVTDVEERAHTQRRPTDYFRGHIYVTFWFERSAPSKLLSEIGAGNILVETDIPHANCLYPTPREHFGKVLADVPTTAVRRILQENAAELYRIAI
jgi:predicted TIM-barrel fold metal-dependent hydrolase